MSGQEKELTYGETIKQTFPELEDDVTIKPKDAARLMLDGKVLYLRKSQFGENHKVKWKSESNKFAILQEDGYWYEISSFDRLYLEPKQIDTHAEIKARHEEALKKYDVVKVLLNGEEYKTKEIYFDSTVRTYEIKCYNINWNKLLSWSYANGEFIKCEFADFRTFENVKTHKILAYDGRSFCANNMNGDWFANCRLAPNVTIKDEWLKEVK